MREPCPGRAWRATSDKGFQTPGLLTATGTGQNVNQKLFSKKEHHFLLMI